MLIPASALGEIGRLLGSSTSPWRAAAVDVEVDPLDFVRAAHRSSGFAAFFGRPGGTQIGAVGEAWRAERGEPPVVEAMPLLDAFAFDEEGPCSPEWHGFGRSVTVLPQVAVWDTQGGRRLAVVLAPGQSPDDVMSMLGRLEVPAPAGPVLAAGSAIESHPTPGDWVQAVEDAVAAIRSGAVQKVVLARSVVVRSDAEVLPFDLAVRLRSAYRDCYTYAWQEGSGTFVGSSPELLAAVDGNRIVSEPLAGTAARGGSDELDRALGETLMASKKNRSEHRMVVEDIADRLADITLDLDVPARPMLRRTANVQHLATRITGILDSPRSVGDVARILHPTPAIGGVPRDESAAFIRKLEQIDRGWYAGAVGWSDHTGEGEMALALRCALIRGKEARLFAGNGIVAGSEPTAELEETRLKFRPLLSLLTEV